ncbi:MAG: hypothetical protein K5696_12060 [Lachnospiraceae bacterium]|nr:hypothetical protein [Lachnospiraceae bacterium]
MRRSDLKRTAAVILCFLAALTVLSGCADVSVLLPYKKPPRLEAYEDPEEEEEDVEDEEEEEEEEEEDYEEEEEEHVEEEEEPEEEIIMPEQEPPVEETPVEPVPEEPAREDAPEAPVRFTPGTVTDVSYENTTLGIGLQLDFTWTYATPEELKKTNGLKTEATVDSVTAFLDDPKEYIDMDVVSGGIGNEISVSVINSMFIASEDMAQISADSAEALAEQLKAAGGYEEISTETREVNFLGESKMASVVTSVYQGTKVTQMQIHSVKNRYFYTVSILVFGEDKPEDMFGNFYEVKPHEGTQSEGDMT